MYIRICKLTQIVEVHTDRNNIFTDGERSGGATICAPQTITINARMNSSISKTSVTYKIDELLISGQYQTYTESEKIMLPMATIRAMQTRKLTSLVLVWAASASGYSSESLGESLGRTGQFQG